MWLQKTHDRWRWHMLEWHFSTGPKSCHLALESKASRVLHHPWWHLLHHSSSFHFHRHLHRRYPYHPRHLMEPCELFSHWNYAYHDKHIPYWSATYSCQRSQVAFFHFGTDFVKMSPWRGLVWNLSQRSQKTMATTCNIKYLVIATVPLGLSNPAMMKSWAPVFLSISLTNVLISSAKDLSAFLRNSWHCDIIYGGTSHLLDLSGNTIFVPFF